MAQDVNLAWTLPDMRDNNVPLPVSEIANVEIALSPDNVNWTVYNTFPPATLSTTIPQMDPGDWYFRGIVIDTGGRRGAAKTASVTVLSAPGALKTLTATLA